MKEIFIRRSTLVEGYHNALTELFLAGENVTDPRNAGKLIREMSLTLVIEHPTLEPMISKLAFVTPESLEQYRMEMLEGLLDWSVLIGREAYTYHYRMTGWTGMGDYNQLRFCIEELKRNPTSRRAVIDFYNVMDDMGHGEIPCLNHIQFLVRGHALDMKVLFRSEDATRAAFQNMFALILLQEQMAAVLGLMVGSYTHRVNSFHCYQDCFDDLSAMSGRICGTNNEELAYTYRTDNGDTPSWEAMMEAERPGIVEKIREVMRK